MVATKPYLAQPVVFVPAVGFSKVVHVGIISKVMEQPDGSFRVNLHSWNDWGLAQGAHQNIPYLTDADFPKNGKYCRPAGMDVEVDCPVPPEEPEDETEPEE